MSKQRHVDDAEVLGLLNRGSARLTRYRRARDTETYIGADAAVRRWRESQLSTTIAWVLVVVVHHRRQPHDDRPRRARWSASSSRSRPAPDWWSDFTSAWNNGGLGATAANPTGWGVVSIASVLWLWRMGLGLTVIVVGLDPARRVGRVAAGDGLPVEPGAHRRPRVYAAIPLVPGVVSTGRLSGLVAYAAVPWFVHLLRNAAGIGTADPAADVQDLVEGVLDLRRPRARPAHGAARPRRRRSPCRSLRRPAGPRPGRRDPRPHDAGRRRRVRTAGWLGGLGLAACVVGYVLNLPWSATWSWDDLVAPTLAGAPGRGARRRRVDGDRPQPLRGARPGVYVPVIVALLVARAWRLTWAARAAGLVVVFLGLAILQDRDTLPFRVPEIGVLLAPVGLGLAIAAAAGRGGVRSRRRRAHVRVAPAARAAGPRRRSSSAPSPALFASPTARGTPRGPASSRPSRPRCPGDGGAPRHRPVGDYRTLYIGDPRLIPFPSQDLGDGVAIALVDDGPVDLRDRWAVPDQAADATLRATLRADRVGGTRRAAACWRRSASVRSSCPSSTAPARPPAHRCRCQAA